MNDPGTGDFVQRPISQDVLPTLTALARQGDADAFGRLYEHYRPHLRNHLFLQLRGRPQLPELVEDLLHDAFAKAWAGIGKTNPDLNFGAWLWRITVNVLLDFCRHDRLVKWSSLDDYFNRSDRAAGWLWRGVPNIHLQRVLQVAEGRQPPPEQLVIQAEQSAAVRSILVELPERQQVALLLQVYGQMSYVEIAQVMNTTNMAVKSLIHRARNTVRDRWLEVADEW